VNKSLIPNARAALAGLLNDDRMIMSGGFGLCGIPENLNRRDQGMRSSGGLPSSRTRPGIDGAGLGILLESGQIRR